VGNGIKSVEIKQKLLPQSAGYFNDKGSFYVVLFVIFRLSFPQVIHIFMQ
jgi:hypothetical protein